VIKLTVKQSSGDAKLLGYLNQHFRTYLADGLIGKSENTKHFSRDSYASLPELFPPSELLLAKLSFTPLLH
jgi:hypothetical protein